jgi:AcrR family transcriptional regulator
VRGRSSPGGAGILALLIERFGRMIKPTAQTIVEAALATLRDEGFAGATSRAIARRGALNQALIFYHFGSLENLLVAALEQTSEERLARYRDAVGPVETLADLLPVMTALWAEDREAGHVRIVAQVIAGSANRPELCSRVVELMEPWNELARQTLARVLPAGLPAAELGYATVVWYLGANLVAYLDPGGGRLEALFDEARRWTPLLEPLLAAPR